MNTLSNPQQPHTILTEAPLSFLVESHPLGNVPAGLYSFIKGCDMELGQQINGAFFKPVSGIYKITNLYNGRCYIGQSSCVQHRFVAHVLDLEKSKHHSKSLQEDWNRYGAGSFVFELLECVEGFPARTKRETEIIDSFQMRGREIYNSQNH